MQVYVLAFLVMWYYGFKVEYKLVTLIIDKGLCNVYGFVSFEPSVTEASLRTPLTSHSLVTVKTS